MGNLYKIDGFDRKGIKTLKQINESFFEELNLFLMAAISEYNSKGVENKIIEIYMPDYLLKMWQSYLSFKTTYREVEDKFCGIEIISNYQHNVVVSYRDALLHRIEPKILQVP